MWTISFGKQNKKHHIVLKEMEKAMRKNTDENLFHLFDFRFEEEKQLTI